MDNSAIGFIVIVILYSTIGLMAVAGSIFLTRKIFWPKSEQIFYGIFLGIIATFYLAFTAYFGIDKAWPLELKAVVAFTIAGLIGVRLTLVLIIGYLAHGLWDILHELAAHNIYNAYKPGQLTAIPLAYGVFCLTYDVGISVYFFVRRNDWAAAWRTYPR